MVGAAAKPPRTPRCRGCTLHVEASSRRGLINEANVNRSRLHWLKVNKNKVNSNVAFIKNTNIHFPKAIKCFLLALDPWEANKK